MKGFPKLQSFKVYSVGVFIRVWDLGTLIKGILALGRPWNAFMDVPKTRFYTFNLCLAVFSIEGTFPISISKGLFY